MQLTNRKDKVHLTEAFLPHSLLMQHATWRTTSGSTFHHISNCYLLLLKLFYPIRFSSSQSPPPLPQPKSKSNTSSSRTPFAVDSSSKTSDNSFNYALATNGTDPAWEFVRSTESGIENVFFFFC